MVLVRYRDQYVSKLINFLKLKNEVVGISHVKIELETKKQTPLQGLSIIRFQETHFSSFSFLCCAISSEKVVSRLIGLSMSDFIFIFFRILSRLYPDKIRIK